MSPSREVVDVAVGGRQPHEAVVGAESLEQLAEHDLVDVLNVVEVDVLGALVVLRHLLDGLLGVGLVRRVGLVVLLGGRRSTMT